MTQIGYKLDYDCYILLKTSRRKCFLYYKLNYDHVETHFLLKIYFCSSVNNDQRGSRLKLNLVIKCIGHVDKIGLD